MKITTCMGIVGLTLLVSHVTLGDEGEGTTVWDGFSGFLSPDWGKDFSASIGAKVWLNEWTTDSFSFSFAQAPLGTLFGEPVLLRVDAQDSQPNSIISDDIEPTPIPQLGIRYKWMFLTGSYYTKTDFEFETAETETELIFVSNDGSVMPLNTRTDSSRLSGERFEWDVGGGIYVLPNVAILGGYKKVVQSFDETLTIRNSLDSPVTPDLTPFSFDTNVEIRGPTIGIAASVPISKGFGFYASYAHGFIEVEISERISDGGRTEVEEDGDYNVAELGFTYTHGTKDWAPHMPISAATAYVGYRYQVIETDLNDPDQDRTDITKGFAAGVNLSF